MSVLAIVKNNILFHSIVTRLGSSSSSTSWKPMTLIVSWVILLDFISCLDWTFMLDGILGRSEKLIINVMFQKSSTYSKIILCFPLKIFSVWVSLWCLESDTFQEVGSLLFTECRLQLYSIKSFHTNRTLMSMSHWLNTIFISESSQDLVPGLWLVWVELISIYQYL